MFHVDCFRCKVCDAPLKKGDLFGMHEDVPYCHIHYKLITSSTCGIVGGGNHHPSPKPPHLQNPNGRFGPDPLNHSPVDIKHRIRRSVCFLLYIVYKSW